MEDIVDVAVVKVAAEVESVIVTLVVNLSDWEWSQPSWFHSLIDIWQVNVL